jgi:hypothetical protein
MTDEELQAIKARVAAATPGPWAMSRDEMSAGFGQHRYVVVGTTTADGKKLVDWRLLVEGMRGADAVHDAEFIAHARTDEPALLAEVERLRAERIIEREAIEDILPCQFRFSNRQTLDLNLVYSVRQLVGALNELRANGGKYYDEP